MEQKLMQYNFNQASKTYLKHASIQKVPALKTIEHLSRYHTNGLVLDLGSGPGTLLHGADSRYESILYDLSLDMLKTGAGQSRALAVTGDAQYLPFATGSIVTVISNLMLQWPYNKLQILNEINRILAPNGIMIFTTLIQPSLWQLQLAWKNFDSVPHTLDFLSMANYSDIIAQAGLKVLHSETWETINYFPDIHALFCHFKLTGTSMPKSKRGHGIGGRKIMEQLQNIYLKHPKGLPLSYHYLLFVVQKDVTYA